MAKSLFPWLLPVLLLLLASALSGCHDGDAGPLTTVTQILSDPAVDGDIAKDVGVVPPVYTINHAADTGNVLAGISSPTSPIEFRGFLHFPLGGAGGVPAGAGIASATLDIFVQSVTGASSFSLIFDLVDFTPPLIATDFEETSLPPLASRTVPFGIGDAGQEVIVDVTGLMQEAQRLGLPAFQVRILLSFYDPAGQVGIVDLSGSTTTAPLLQVEYF
jgi:hypothetical protein